MPPLAENFGFDTPQIVMVALALGILTMVMISTQRRMRAAQRMPQPSMRERIREHEQHAKAREGLEQVMIELDQFCRQLHGRLDTKLARLEAVVRDADRRIDTLSRLVRQAGGQPSINVTLGEACPHDQPDEPAPDVEDDRHATVYRLADRGLPAADIAQQVGVPTGEVELILSLRRARNTTRRVSDETRMTGIPRPR